MTGLLRIAPYLLRGTSIPVVLRTELNISLGQIQIINQIYQLSERKLKYLVLFLQNYKNSSSFFFSIFRPPIVSSSQGIQEVEKTKITFPLLDFEILQDSQEYIVTLTRSDPENKYQNIERFLFQGDFIQTILSQIGRTKRFHQNRLKKFTLSFQAKMRLLLHLLCSMLHFILLLCHGIAAIQTRNNL